MKMDLFIGLKNESLIFNTNIIYIIILILMFLYYFEYPIFQIWKLNSRIQQVYRHKTSFNAFQNVQK